MAGDVFKNKIRLRVNGILKKDESVLLVRLKSPVSGGLIWMPPGGGVQFGELMESALQREFLEETGLEVEPQDFVFMNELVSPPFHAVECYFRVQRTGGNLKMGIDPELPDKEQILQDMQWVPVKKLDDYQVVPKPLPKLLQETTRSNQNSIFYSQI